MFANKYNPDVNNEFKKENINRSKTKYNLLNNPYKQIINDKVVKKKKNLTSKDFIIEVESDNLNVIDNYNNIIKDRNVKNVKCNKEELEKFKNELMLQSNMENFESKDFNDIKDDFKSEYESEEKILKEQRNKVNSIINSLLDDGILD
tara:strand:+ start:63 stop:506 length:444 start_codon:yes stop_codon:yes gene_type:complete